MSTFAENLVAEIFADLDADDNTNKLTDEPEFAEEQVREAIQALGRFKSLRKVNPQSAEVETLLLVSGFNSWQEFQAQHKDLLLEYLDADERESRNTLPDLSHEVLERKKKLLARADKAVTERRKAITEWKKNILQLEKTGREARMEFLATKGLSYGDYPERNQRARDLFNANRVAYEKLQMENPEANIKQLEKAAQMALAEVRFAEKAVRGEYTHWINTGKARKDAEDYIALMDRRAFRMSYLLKDEAKFLDKIAKERYRSPDSSESEGDTMSPDSFNTRRLREIRDNMQEIYEEVACLSHGYQQAEQSWTPTYEGESFPEWLTLEEHMMKKERYNQPKTDRDESIFSTAL